MPAKSTERPAKPSQLDIAKHKGQVLDLIMSWKRQEVPKQMALMPMEQVRAFAQLAPLAWDFAGALVAQPGVSLIAEIKRASPSRGLIARDWDPPLIASTYSQSGAAAISCLTDSRFFQGELEYLTSAKERLQSEGRLIPFLRKDFIYHEYQIHQARMAGADAVLLIVAALSDQDLKRLHTLTRSLGMEALVEVHDEAELDRALAVDARIIGVNNRDLRTFQVDLDTTARLRERIPAGKILVSESGIQSPDDVTRLAQIGCDAMLVGETFCRLRQPERLGKVQEFVAAGQQKSAAQRA